MVSLQWGYGSHAPYAPLSPADTASERILASCESFADAAPRTRTAGWPSGATSVKVRARAVIHSGLARA